MKAVRKEMLEKIKGARGGDDVRNSSSSLAMKTTLSDSMKNHFLSLLIMSTLQQSRGICRKGFNSIKMTALEQPKSIII